MKTLGLIGGTSWHSTITYYKLLNELFQNSAGTDGNPPLILYSQDISLMRSRDFPKINQTYLDTAQKLQSFGADAILICANTPHLVYDYVQPCIEIPIIHIANPVGQKAASNHHTTLGLLGNKPTMKMGFIQKYLEQHFNINTVILDEDKIDQSNWFISNELTRGIFSTKAKNFYLNSIEELKAKGAEGIILGCTELPILIQSEDTDIALYDTTLLHVQAGLSFILQ